MGKFSSLILLLFIPLSEATCPTTLPTDASFTSANQYHSGSSGTVPSTHLLSYSNPSSSIYSLAYPIVSGSFIKTPSTQCPQSCLVRLRAMGKPSGESLSSIVMMSDAGQTPPAIDILYTAYTTTVVPGEYFYCSSLVQTCGASIPLYLYYNSKTDDYQVRGTNDTNDDLGAQLANQGLPVCYLFPPVATTTSTSTSSNSADEKFNSVRNGRGARNGTDESQSDKEKPTKRTTISRDEKIRPTEFHNANSSDAGERKTGEMKSFTPDFGRFSKSHYDDRDDFNSTGKPARDSLPGMGFSGKPELMQNITIDSDLKESKKPFSPRDRSAMSTVFPSFPSRPVTQSRRTSTSVADGNANGPSAHRERENESEGEGKKNRENNQKANNTEDLMGDAESILPFLGHMNGKRFEDMLPSNMSLHDLNSQFDGNKTMLNRIPKEAIEQSLKDLGVKLPGNVSVGSIIEEVKKGLGGTTVGNSLQFGLLDGAMKSLGIDLPANFSVSSLLDGLRNESKAEENKNWKEGTVDKFNLTLNESHPHEIHTHDNGTEFPFGGKGRPEKGENSSNAEEEDHKHKLNLDDVLSDLRHKNRHDNSTRGEEHGSGLAMNEGPGNKPLHELDSILERFNVSLNESKPVITIERTEDGSQLVAMISLPEVLSEAEVEAMRNESGSNVRVNGTKLTVTVPIHEKNGTNGSNPGARVTRGWTHSGTMRVTHSGDKEQSIVTKGELTSTDTTSGPWSGQTRSDGEVNSGKTRHPHESKATGVTKGVTGSTMRTDEGPIEGSTRNENTMRRERETTQSVSVSPTRTIQTSTSNPSTGTTTNGMTTSSTPVSTSVGPKASSTSTISSLSTTTSNPSSTSTTGGGSSSPTSSPSSVSTTTTTTPYTGPSTTVNLSASTTSGPSTLPYTGPSTTVNPLASTTSGPSTTAYTGPSTTVNPLAPTTSGPSTTAYTGPSTTFNPLASTTSGPSTTAYTGPSTTADPSVTSTTGPSTTSGSTMTTPRPTTTTSPYVYTATTDTSGTYEPGDQKLENGTIVRTNGDMIYPNGTVKTADGSVIENGKKIDSDGTVHNPDGSTVFPNGTVVYPPSSDGSTSSGSSGDSTPSWIIPVIIVATMLIGVGALAMIFFGVTSMMRGASAATTVNPYDVPNGQQWPNQKQPSPSADLPPSVTQPVTTAQPQSFGATQSLAAPNSLYFG